MASFMKAADALAAAVEIERRGYDFYLKAAREAENGGRSGDAEFFAFMAAEEQRHESVFSAMLRRVGGLDLPAGAEAQEYQDYVSVILDSHNLFNSEFYLVNGDPYAIAIQFEKDSIIFFAAMERMVPESERGEIERCIAEERGHLRLIARKKAAER